MQQVAAETVVILLNRLQRAVDMPEGCVDAGEVQSVATALTAALGVLNLQSGDRRVKAGLFEAGR